MMIRNVFFIVTLLVSHGLWAVNLQVNPIHLFLDNEHPIATLEMTNHENEPIILQLDLRSWKQNSAGKDLYETTSDLIASPPLFTLAGKGSQIVRIALLNPQQKQNELTYRLILREVVPQNFKSVSKGRELKIALQMLIPIFVGYDAKAEPEFHWIIDKSSSNQTTIKLTNSGHQHFMVNQLTLLNRNHQELAKARSLFDYLLPGTTKTFTIQSAQSLPNKEAMVLKINN